MRQAIPRGRLILTGSATASVRVVKVRRGRVLIEDADGRQKWLCGGDLLNVHVAVDVV